MMTPQYTVLLLLSLVVTAASWLLLPATAPSTPATATSDDASFSNNRRSFLSKTTAAVVATSLLQVATARPKVASAAAAAALSPAGALSQWKASVTTIDRLLENWDAITKGGGDAIRKELGTANFGTETSPLFQIDKAFKVLREGDDVVADLIEFTEQSEEFSSALARADTMAYSANFTGGSGKPTPPQVYIDKSRKEVEGLQRIAKSLSSLL